MTRQNTLFTLAIAAVLATTFPVHAARLIVMSINSGADITAPFDSTQAPLFTPGAFGFLIGVDTQDGSTVDFLGVQELQFQGAGLVNLNGVNANSNLSQPPKIMTRTEAVSQGSLDGFNYLRDDTYVTDHSQSTPLGSMRWFPVLSGYEGGGAFDDFFRVSAVLGPPPFGFPSDVPGGVYPLAYVVTTSDLTVSGIIARGASGFSPNGGPLGQTLTIALPSPASVSWNNPAGGPFQTATNWTPSYVPNSSIDAVFDLPGTYTVNFTADFAVSKSLVVRNGDVTIDLASQGYGTALLEIGAVSGTAALTISGGFVSAYDLSEGGGIHVGKNGDGILRIVNGAEVHIEGLGVVHVGSTNGSGLLIVDGPASTLEHGGHDAGTQIVVSQGSSVIVQNGGQLLAETGFTLHGSLRITGLGSFAAIVADLDSFRVVDTGTLDVSSGASMRSFSLVVENGEATITGPDSSLQIDSRLTVGTFGAALLQITDTAKVIVGSELAIGSGGIARLSGGSITIGSGPAEITPDVLRVWAGGELTGTGNVIGNIINSGGTVAPGFSPGTLHVQGNYLQESGGLLLMEVGGLNPTDMDLLDVTGNVDLAGKISLTFINGFAPRMGQQFEFIHAGGAVVGNPLIEFPNLAPGFLYETSLADGTLMLTAMNDGVLVPEPSTFALAVLGLIATVGLVARRGRASPS